jgi:3-keto-disaccharide hydrolase
MIVIRSKLSLFLFFVVLSTAILPARGIFAAEKVLVMMPNSDTLDGWKFRGPKFMSKWVVGVAKEDPKDIQKLTIVKSDDSAIELINTKKGGVDIYTEQEFGDCTVEIEVMIPKGSNSGIYLMGQYEVQVADSYGKKSFKDSAMGAIFGVAAPKINAAKKPGEWQKFLIEFKAPRFENRKRIAAAEFVKVALNGEVIHENMKIEKGPTSGALKNREFAKGPLMLQGGMGAVAYRHIRISVPGQ